MAFSGDLATLQYSSSSATGFSSLTSLVDFAKTPSSAVMLKTTQLSDVTDTFIPAKVINNGQIKATIRHDKALIPTLKGFQDNGTGQYWKITLNDSATTGSTWVGFGYVSEFTPAKEVKNATIVDSDIVITISGALTFTAGT